MLKEIFKAIILILIVGVGTAAQIVRKAPNISTSVYVIAAILEMIIITLPVVLTWYSFVDKVFRQPE